MGVYEGRGQLGKLMKDLVLRWNEAKMSWDDAMSDKFEKEHIIPLETDLRNAVGAMDQMAVLLSTIRQACE